MSVTNPKRPPSPACVASWWVNRDGYEVLPSIAEFNGTWLTSRQTVDGRISLIPSDMVSQLPEPYVEESSAWLVTNKSWARPEIRVDENLMSIYDPLRVKGLHRRFADLGTSTKAILEFANEFGFLGSRTYGVVVDDDDNRFGEEMVSWTAHSERLRILIHLWDRLRIGDDPYRFRPFMWVSETEYGLEFPESTRVADRYSHLTNYTRINELGTAPDTTSMARAAIRNEVRSVLADNSAPWFELGPGGQLSLSPTNLLGAIYVHFLQELLGRSDPLFRCASCGKWFIQRHAGRMYCGQACKQKAYRRGLTKQKANNG